VGDVRASYPRFRREGGAPRIELTDDDVGILRHVYRHRFLRARDVYRLFPHRSADKLSRRLTWLFRNGFLDRPIAQVDRFRDGGSQSLVYGLGQLGARRLKEEAGVSVAGADWKTRNRSYTRENLDHTLATSEFLISVELSCRARPRLTYIPFEELVRAAPPITQRQPYPGRWAVSLVWKGMYADVHVVPDAIFALRQDRGESPPARSCMFVEIDRGSMTIAPSTRIQESEAFLYRATLLRKFAAYAESWRHDRHYAHLGIRTPRVLFLTQSSSRAEAMRLAAAKYVIEPSDLPVGMFLFGTHTDEDPLDMPYHDAAGMRVWLAGASVAETNPERRTDATAPVTSVSRA
jgi:hypothetical protein